MAEFTPEKSKQIALARLDVVHKWLEFRKKNLKINSKRDLFSGGRKRAFLKIKKYQYEQALNDYQQTFLVGVKEVNSGLAEYKTTLKNYEEAKKRLEFENKIYTLAQNKKQIGSASDLDVLFAKEMFLMTEKRRSL